MLRMLKWSSNGWLKGLPVRCMSDDLPKAVLMKSAVFGAGNDDSKSPVIIMHGLFGSMQNWRRVSQVLEKKIRRRIYTVDARNHGESPHTAEHSSPALAADLAEFIRHHGMKKAGLVGHSMGGRAIMYLALSHPELIDRAVVVDISPISSNRDPTEMEDICVAMRESLSQVKPDLSMGEGRKVIRKYIQRVLSTEQTLDFIMLNLRKRDNGEFYWAANVDSLQVNLRKFSMFLEHVERYPPFKGPMLFICGTKSVFVDPESWPEVQKIYPNAEIHWLDCGHLVHFEEPDKFIELVTNFFNK